MKTTCGVRLRVFVSVIEDKAYHPESRYSSLQIAEVLEKATVYFVHGGSVVCENALLILSHYLPVIPGEEL